MSAGAGVGGSASANAGSGGESMGGTGQAGDNAAGGSGGVVNGGATGGGSSGSAGSSMGGSSGYYGGGKDPCNRSNWRATASEYSQTPDPPSLYGPPQKAIDGVVESRWTTGAPQGGGEWFQLDLGADAAQLSKLVLYTGDFATDFPVSYKLEISDDGTSFKTVAMGDGAASTTMSFTPRTGRYLRVTQTGSSPSWWSITELSLACQAR